MNSKVQLLTVLAASLLVVSVANIPADAKTNKKLALKCHQKKHFLLTGCSKPSADTAWGTGGHGGGNSGGGGGNVSDRRLKHDLRLVGTTVFGLPLYDFQYNGQRGTYEGVMAQDVLKVKPEAVTTGPDGYYRVNYGMLGVRLKRIR